jgi:hypothetical protein
MPAFNIATTSVFLAILEEKKMTEINEKMGQSKPLIQGIKLR